MTGRRVNGQFERKHGMTGTPELRAWDKMTRRCTDQRLWNYRRYGGRGITVCERWTGENGFANFLADMGPRPGDGYSLDRTDNDRGYCPENCRWATRIEQGSNKSNNHRLTFQGETLTSAEWSRRLGLARYTIERRTRAGWSAEETLTTPSRIKNARKAHGEKPCQCPAVIADQQTEEA
jgi:hypothetical protein